MNKLISKNKKISIVIVTYNRAKVLDDTLNSLYYLNYPDLEVIVVYGPCTDNTLEIIEKYKHDIKIGHCPIVNISIARNIGIAMSSGEYVAFIDDDAIPHPNWLNNIMLGFTTEEVAGVGSDVYCEDGVTFQCRKVIGNRFDLYYPNIPTQPYMYPYTFWFINLIGVNSIFKKDYLLNINGFDEQYEYHLDETDVCARLIDYGYIINYIEDAPVYHKVAPSHIRKTKDQITNWYVYSKNSTYYIKTYEKIVGKHQADIAVLENVKNRLNNLTHHYKKQTYTHEEFLTYKHDLENGVKQGLKDAERGPLLLTKETLEKYKSEYKKFPNYINRLERKKTIVFLTHEYPPKINGGICILTYNLATYMAKLGHNVYVFVPGDKYTVTFEENVWVHRLVTNDMAYDMYKELLSVNKMSKIDIVQSFLWENLSYYILQDKLFKSVVTLVTPAVYLINYINKVCLAKEKFIVENTDYLTSDSHFIYDYCKKEYPNIRSNMQVIYLGLKDQLNNKDLVGKNFKNEDKIEILFVGRLEHRKGIDLLFQCIPDICYKYPNVIFRFIGSDGNIINKKITYKKFWIKKNKGKPYFDNVIFEGNVKETYSYYKNCDIFVAPSRFESFGLIFLEAMMFSKPVVSFNVSAIPEVVENNVTGLLAEVENFDSLKSCLLKLIENKDLRIKMGIAGRKRYEEHFTLEKCANRFLQFYDEII